MSVWKHIIDRDSEKDKFIHTKEMKLEIENLTFQYGKKGREVLSDVNLSLETGEVIGLLGPNGAGKSTLLYLISGALTPGKGLITYEGKSTRKRLPSVLADIYLVAEEVELPRMTLEEYVRLHSKFYPHFDRRIMEDSLKEFGLESPVRIDNLSMGQKKKIVLSFAFACNAAVTLLDEPTNGLDIPGKAAFRRMVARLAGEDRLFLISTHQVRDLDTILDRVIIMNDYQFLFNARIPEIQDKLIFEGRSSEVREDTLYAIPSIGGTDFVAPNTTGDETEVNLELLFGAVMEKPEEVNQIMNS